MGTSRLKGDKIMKDKLEVGMYVRTKKGIAKIIGQNDDVRYCYPNAYISDTYLGINDDTEYLYEEDILKSSNNIIDILEEGDYVNGVPVEGYYTRYDEEKDDYIKIGIITLEDYWKGTFTSIEDIKSIVTSQQFENMQYKVD